MTDPVDEFIDEIHVELCRMCACTNQRIRQGEQVRTPSTVQQAIFYTIGAADFMCYKGTPSVSWVETGGSTDPLSDSEDGKLFIDKVRLRVLIQAQSKELCRKLFMNLRNASMRVCGTQISWGASTAPTEEKGNLTNELLFAIEADADLLLSVPSNPQQLPGFPSAAADYTLRPVVSATDQTLDHME